MWVISRRKIREFLENHPSARDAALPLDRWYRIAKTAEWRNFQGLKADYNSVDQVGHYVVFNIGGNKYRLVAEVNYQHYKIFIRFIGTHREYDSLELK